jgi:hypothetical protein
VPGLGEFIFPIDENGMGVGGEKCSDGDAPEMKF